MPVFFMYRQTLSCFKISKHSSPDIFKRNSLKSKIIGISIRLLLIYSILKIICSFESDLSHQIFGVTKMKDNNKFMSNSLNSLFMAYLIAGGPYDHLVSIIENLFS